MAAHGKSKKWGKVVLMVSSIAALNLTGLSYAYWDENTNIFSGIKTGYISPEFIHNSLDIEDEGDGKINVGFENPYTMVITGEASPGYSANVFFNIADRGSLPVKYQNADAPGSADHGSIQTSVNLGELGKPAPAGTSQLTVQVGEPVTDKETKEQTEITQSFEIRIPFAQDISLAKGGKE